MSAVSRLRSINDVAGRIECLAPVLTLVTRSYVSWVFLKSGLLKLRDWESTLFLFREEYRVPLLSPEAAAVIGTAAELLFPLLLIFGIAARLSAAALFAVNVLAVVSYAHVLMQSGFEAAVAQHYLWGFMLAMVIVYGAGAWSVDEFLNKHV